ncbi:50S ribosomal protein L3 [Christensenellaceae bacterium OttesenSCG-928-L17]|nr:50S ribosomal protein L3 [Christensenellaceae bacterium OttesenSCG-928-L17]
MKVILGTKIGMTQIIGKDGLVTPVTILQAGPATVTQIKSIDTDGYNAVQLGIGQSQSLSKPQSGHLKKAGTTSKHTREFRFDELPEVKTGDTITVESFSLGDKVTVTGTSKGKGFAGTIKKYNFQESKQTHGGNGNVRRVGSIGSMYPQKVWKGKKMPGRMGHDTVTVKNLVVAYIDSSNNLLGLKGAVPGPNKSIITVEGKE